MKDSDPIQVLGRGTDVQFTIDDTVPFEIAERSLREYLDVCRGLYSRGTVSVNVGRRILFPEQLSTIKDILAEETGLTVTEYWCPPETLQKALAGPDPHRASPVPGREVVRDVLYGSKSSAELGGHNGLPATPDDFDSPEQRAPDVEPAGAPPAQQLQLAFPDMGAGSVAVGGLEPADELPAGTLNEETVQVVTLPDSIDVPPVEVLADSSTEAQEPVAYAGEVNEDQDADNGQPTEDNNTEFDTSEPPSGSESSASDVAAGPLLSPPIRGNEALIIKTTCRSGEIVRYPGDVVVFGDVNPGAEIVAGGDIVVVGALRGMAHAGCDGDSSATIFALNLEAHRLQIGPHIGESPRGQERARSGKGSANPKIAYLRRNSLFVAPFVRRREEYQGGILYEG